MSSKARTLLPERLLKKPPLVTVSELGVFSGYHYASKTVTGGEFVWAQYGIGAGLNGGKGPPWDLSLLVLR
jgi:hypothetical protein